MYKISTRGQYALLIMEDLALADADKYVPLKLLSHRRNLSVKYLEQILIHLSKSGLVTGIRGPIHITLTFSLALSKSAISGFG